MLNRTNNISITFNYENIMQTKLNYENIMQTTLNYDHEETVNKKPQNSKQFFISSRSLSNQVVQ